jgi:hypothetical protein
VADPPGAAPESTVMPQTGSVTDLLPLDGVVMEFCFDHISLWNSNINPLIFAVRKHSKRIWTIAAWCCLFIPVWASGWMPLQIEEPAEQWDLQSLPLAPAPFENPGDPLWIGDDDTSLWSYPTEVEFVAYSEHPYDNAWVTRALEKYQIRLESPVDLPYPLTKTPISLYGSQLTTSL